MKMFEDLALGSIQWAPIVWKHYVDDTFCVLEREHVQLLLGHLNSLRPSIQFTIEMKEDRCIPFLDTFLLRKEDGSINMHCFEEAYTHRSISALFFPRPHACYKECGFQLIPSSKDCGY